MNFRFSGSDLLGPGTAGLAPLLAIFWVIWWIILLVVLYCLLARKDMDPVTKFMWVFVILTVPVFGVIFYELSPATKPKWNKDSSPGDQ